MEIIILLINQSLQATGLSPVIFTQLLVALGIIGLLLFIGHTHRVLENEK